MTLKLALQILVGLTGYGVWGVMAYYDPSLRADFLKLNVAMVTGTIGLLLRDMRSSNE